VQIVGGGATSNKDLTRGVGKSIVIFEGTESSLRRYNESGNWKTGASRRLHKTGLLNGGGRRQCSVELQASKG